MARFNGLVSQVDVFAALVDDGATAYLDVNDYVRATPSAGRDPRIVRSPYGRSIRLAWLQGSGDHVNLSVGGQKLADVREGGKTVTKTVARQYHVVRDGRPVFDRFRASFASPQLFRALRKLGCLPDAGTRFDPSETYELTLGHLPLIDARWNDPGELVKGLRREAELLALRTALYGRRDSLRDRGIPLATPRRPAKGASDADDGRPFHDERLTAKDKPSAIESAGRFVRYSLPEYEPEKPAVGKIAMQTVADRLAALADELADTRLRVAFAKIAIDHFGDGPEVAWTAPAPRRKGASGATQSATIAGDTVVRLLKAA